jgi:hypothetical protein
MARRRGVIEAELGPAPHVQRVAFRGVFDPRSFRWIRSPRTGPAKAWILIGCRKGDYDPMTKRCRTGTRAYEVVRSRSRARAKGLAANPELMIVNNCPYKDNPDFQKALRKYREFHGTNPTRISRHLLPIGDPRKVEGRAFFVALGRAPADSYTPPPTSRKAGRTYVHPYEKQPLRAVDSTGKLLVTLPGSHSVTDWIRG